MCSHLTSSKERRGFGTALDRVKYMARTQRIFVFPIFMLPLVISAAACTSTPTPVDDEPFVCEGACDAFGPMTLSTTWTSRGGFIRVQLEAGHRLEVSPMAGVTATNVGGTRWIVDFADEGFYDLSALLGARTVVTQAVRVSDSGPSVQLEWPAAGSAIIASDGETAEVSGSIIDPLGTPAMLTHEGRELYLTSNAYFRFDEQLRFGVNVLDLVVVDRAGNSFRFSPSFIAAESFGVEATRNVISLDDAALATFADVVSERLPELIVIPAAGLVDDGFTTDVYFDGATLPGQGSNSGAMEIRLDHQRRNRLHVTFTAHGTTLGDIRVDTFLSPMGEGQVQIENIQVEMDVTFDNGGESIDPIISNITVEDDGMNIDVDWFPDWVANLAHGTVRDGVRDGVEEQVPELLAQALTGVGGAVTIGGSDSVRESTLYYRLADLSSDDSNLSIGVDSWIEGAGASTRDFPGAPRQGDVIGDGSSIDSMTVALSHDLLNQWFFAQWSAGYLSWRWTEEDLAEALARVEGLEQLDPWIDVVITSSMPPVVEQGPSGELLLSAGGLNVMVRLSSDLFHVSADAEMAFRANLGLRAEGDTLSFDPALQELNINVELAGLAGINTEVAEELIRAAAPEIVERFADRLEDLEVPSFDLQYAGLPGVDLHLDAQETDITRSAVVLGGTVALLPN